MTETAKETERDWPVPPRGGPDIGQALRWLKAGQRVCREGWNGKKMWLTLVEAGGWGCSYASHPRDGKDPPIRQPLPPIVVMKTADGTLIPWLCSQSDLLATDWTPVGSDGQ